MDPLVGVTFSFEGFQQAEDDAPRGGSGSQVLPVAEIDPALFSGVPVDGSEYLYMVRADRMEAQKMPAIARMQLVQAVEQHAERMRGEQEEGLVERTPSSRPSEAWRQAFLSNFRGFRQRLADLPKNALGPDDYKPPGPKNVKAWRNLIRGELLDSEDDDEDDEEMTLEQAKAAALAALEEQEEEEGPRARFRKGREPKPPTTDFIAAMDHYSTTRVLGFLDKWFGESVEAYEALLGDPDLAGMPLDEALALHRPPLPSSNDAVWLLSLLGRLDDLLDGNELSKLRDLCRTLVSMAETSQVVRSNRVEVGRSKADREMDERDAEGRAACWMVVAAVSGIWKQNDLWQDES